MSADSREDFDRWHLGMFMRKADLSNLMSRMAYRAWQASRQDFKWIECSDRLPLDREGVLAYCAGSECCGYAHYSYELGQWFTPEPQAIASISITHWMPLPLPPKEQTP